MASASKAREYIEKRRRMFRSPVELQQDVVARYGADAEMRMDYQEAHVIYRECIGWASRNDMAMQDYWAQHCGHSDYWDEENPRPIVTKVVEALSEMAGHLKRGQQLGLSLLEQRVVDTLWQWVPHDYQGSYVACAREVSKAICRLLPPENEERSEKGYEAYYDKVIDEVKLLAEQYDVEFDTSAYNLAVGYFYEWLSDEYGLILEEDLYREDDEEGA